MTYIKMTTAAKENGSEEHTYSRKCCKKQSIIMLEDVAIINVSQHFPGVDKILDEIGLTYSVPICRWLAWQYTQAIS